MLGCHKLSELYRVFETSGGDLNTATHKNYATRPQHLILLSGLTLPEHDNPPIVQHSTSNPTSVAQTSVNNVTLQQQQSPAANSMNPSPQQQQISNPGSVGSPASHHQHQQQQLPPQQMGQQGMRPNMGGMSPMSQGVGGGGSGGMNRGNVGNVMMRPAGVNMPGARPRWQTPMQANQQQQQDSMANKVMVPQQMGQSGMQQQQQPQAPQQPLSIPNSIQSGGGSAQRSIVWQGTLELQDKKDPMGRLDSNRIPCKMTTQVINNEPEVKTDGWPQNLVLQLIPKGILSNLGNSYFKNVHTVMFLPEQCPALTLLTNSLSRAMVS